MTDLQPFSTPGPDEPERVQAAYALALQCWEREEECEDVLDEISRPPVVAHRLTIKAAQEALCHAEDQTCNAIELYVEAIRATRRAQDAETRAIPA